MITLNCQSHLLHIMMGFKKIFLGVCVPFHIDILNLHNAAFILSQFMGSLEGPQAKELNLGSSTCQMCV